MKRVATLVAAVLAVATIAVTVGLVLRGGSEEAHATRAAGHGVSSSRAATDNHHVTVTGGYELSTADEETLAFMREEEKLARDVYAALANTYDMRAFSNISSSESRHMASIKELLTAYDLEDPAAGAARGIFANDELQALYDSLIARGRTSLTAALEAGIAIEKTDIEDLEQALAQTENPEVKAVLTNLLNGSYKHLSAFERQLARYGG